MAKLDKVFLITGNKISSFIADKNSLKFTSAKFDNVESFREAFGKTFSLATKVEIRYEFIKHIRKEDNDKDISIFHKKNLIIPIDLVFSFNDPRDNEVFFDFFEKERYFTKTHETLSPFRAIRNHLIGLIVAIGFTVFAYFQAVDIANGTVGEARSTKVELFNTIVGLLGEKGVIAVGALLPCYLLYKIWTRFLNPPTQIKLLPLNA